MNDIKELIKKCINEFDINENSIVQNEKIRNFEELKTILFKNNFDIETIILNDEEIENNSIFFISKFDETYNKIKFYLILKEKNLYYSINDLGIKKKIDFNNLKENFINEIILIKNKVCKNFCHKNILKDKNWKLIIVISIIYLFVNILTLVNGLFMSIITKYVLKQNSLNNFWWILTSFIFIYVFKILLSLIANYVVKFFINKHFFKWYSIAWESILRKGKDFYNSETNLFIINESILDLVSFSICDIASLFVNFITILISSIVLLLINFWYFIISIFICCISIALMFFKRKQQNEIYTENLIFQNHEKNALNNLYFLKNTYFNTDYYRQNFQYIKQLTNNNYLFNLNKSLKLESIDLLNSIIIHVFNVLMFILMIVININNVEIISNYFFIMGVNNTFLMNTQNIIKLWVKLPEIKLKNKLISEIIDDINEYETGIKINKINSITLLQPCFKNVKLDTEIKINTNICLVGPSGIGKSYFLWSLCNIDKNRSDILINDVHIQNICLNSLKNNIIYLKNDTPIITNKFELLLEDILFENLISSFLQKTKLKIYDIRNNNLSNGQRQMINILNLLLEKDKLILLDEVASNIDNENLDFFNKHIFPIIMQKNLVITVSHNPTIIQEYKEKINLYEFIQKNHNS